MSNIYIQEPSSKGKVLLTTSVGEIDIELWSKEAPKACRNFVQLCMEDYYDGTIFHRVVKNFIVQGGDPTGTGTGGESIYGAPFKDEFHSRLRFVRRGLVAMANAGPHDNGSQFFFTLDQTPELMNKHTIFGKVAGSTLFNMLKLNDAEVDANDRPMFPHKIIKTEILFNPFEDIIPRMIKKTKKEKDEDKKVKSMSKATKNFNLLSFGKEAEEDEELTFKASKKFSGKSKSSHDLIDDPRLSSVPAMEASEPEKNTSKRKIQDNIPSVMDTTDEVRKKLKKEKVSDVLKIQSEEDTMLDEKKKRSQEIKKEAKKIKKELKASKKREQAAKASGGTVEDTPQEVEAKNEETGGSTDFLESFKQERQKYKSLKKMQNKPGQSREAQTLAMLAKFQSRLNSVRQLHTGYSDEEEEAEKKEIEESVEEDETNDISWMKHALHFEETKTRKVLDANVTDSDRYEIHDPRNPLTQRRRDASKKKSKQKK